MTIALGLNCYDGIVLATDSLENDGDSKRYVSKIWSFQAMQDWGISIAGAGESDLIDSFTDALEDILRHERFDESGVLLILKRAIKETRKTYPDGQLGMVLGLFSNPKRLVKLFRVIDGSEHVAPVRRYQSIGIASQLTNFLLSQLYSRSLSVEEGISLAIFCIARAKEHIDGVDGPIAVLSFTREDPIWMEKSRQELDAIEQKFLSGDFRFAINNYWRSNNPNPKYSAIPNVPEAGRARKVAVGYFPRKQKKEPAK